MALPFHTDSAEDDAAPNYTERFISALVGTDVQPDVDLVNQLYSMSLTHEEKKKLVLLIACQPSMMQQIRNLQPLTSTIAPNGVSAPWCCESTGKVQGYRPDDVLIELRQREIASRPSSGGSPDTTTLLDEHIPGAELLDFLFS